MTLRVAVQMDELERIDIRHDSTFALLLEASRRGHSLFYYLPVALTMHGDRVLARGQDIDVRDESGRHFSAGEMRVQDLRDMDVVLLRQDPPFNMNYITTTHILERIHPETLVVNDPFHVRNAPEKIFVTEFADLMPPTLITRDPVTIRLFREEHEDMILKPLYGNGGAAVFRVRPDDENLSALLELFDQICDGAFVVQKYLPSVRSGDKRVILVDGRFAGIINRIPAKNEVRSNMHVGGRPEMIAPSQRDLDICARLGPELKERGLLFVGIDVIGDWLTEINVTSPTGIREVSHLGGGDVAALVWDAIEARR